MQMLTIGLLVCCAHLASSYPQLSKEKTPVISALTRKLASSVPNARPNVVYCSDHIHYCENYETCCYSRTYSAFQCCPTTNGVCCYKGDSCCPRFTTCSTYGDKCYQLEEEEIELTELSRPNVRSARITCPDRRSECPEGSTCCIMSSGQYGCCPLIGAVCCSDHLRCCPSGYTCDKATTTCKKQDDSIPMLTKTPAIQPDYNEIVDIICPDGQSQCADNNTCCMLAKEWGCCPYPDAVCCSDRQHCCQEGYKCDVANNRCAKKSNFLPFKNGDNRLI